MHADNSDNNIWKYLAQCFSFLNKCFSPDDVLNAIEIRDVPPEPADPIESVACLSTELVSVKFSQSPAIKTEAQDLVQSVAQIPDPEDKLEACAPDKSKLDSKPDCSDEKADTYTDKDSDSKSDSPELADEWVELPHSPGIGLTGSSMLTFSQSPKNVNQETDLDNDWENVSSADAPIPQAKNAKTDSGRGILRHRQN